MPRNVLLLVNRTKPDAVEALDEVRAIIGAAGRIVAEIESDGDPIGPEFTPDGAAARADIVVVLGGDGTLMSQSRRCANLGLPMLGVNFGKLGFMAEFDLDALRRHGKDLFGDAALRVQDRDMLHVRVDRPSGEKPVDGLCVNDAVVTAGPPFRMISLAMHFDGHPGPSVTGDGLIVSTPMGSTAYNVSAGGPIVAPGVDAMIITPIAAHSLSFRPIVVSGSTEIELIVGRVNDDECGGGTTLVLDGQNSARLSEHDRITIRRHETRIRFVRNPDSNYWTTLINKMHWAIPPRRR